MGKKRINTALIESLDTDEPLNLSDQKDKTSSQNKKGKKEDDKQILSNKSENELFVEMHIPFSKFVGTNKKPIYIEESIHSKLSTISKLTGENISDISSSILTYIIKKNKTVIKEYIDKNIASEWD